jgi:hypothetical protein
MEKKQKRFSGKLKECIVRFDEYKRKYGVVDCPCSKLTLTSPSS